MYHYEPNYWFHCQMDLESAIEDYINDIKTFKNLDEIVQIFNYTIKNREKLSVIIREENDYVLKHKFLVYENNYIVCSFDYEFEDGLPLCNVNLKDLRINNANVVIAYSKWARENKKYKERFLLKYI